jgi:hypothetical protein
MRTSPIPPLPAHIPIQPCATRSLSFVLQCVINDDDDDAPPCPPCPPPPCRCHSVHEGPTATSTVPWAIHFPSLDPHPSASKCRRTTPTRIPCWVASPGEGPFAAATAVMTLLLPPQVVLATLITHHLQLYLRPIPGKDEERMWGDMSQWIDDPQQGLGARSHLGGAGRENYAVVELDRPKKTMATMRTIAC